MCRHNIIALFLCVAACDSGGITLLADSGGDSVATDTILEVLVPADTPPELQPDVPDPLDTVSEVTGDAPVSEVTDLQALDILPPPCLSDADCDDSDKCTLDHCLEEVCVNDLLPPGFCCAVDGDCDDGVICTVDQCLNGACWNLPEDSTCCTKATDCEDFDDCTVDLCIGSTCARVFASDGAECQCENVLDCDDGLPCTDASCVGGICEFQVSPTAAGCCGEAADCDDGDLTTQDVCVQSTCGNAPWGLCLVDSHCDDGDPCTADSCVGGICASELLEGCCHVDAQCSDGLAMTVDLCAGGDCLHVLGAVPEACVSGGDCVEGPQCLAASCTKGYCSYGFQVTPGCCTAASNCDDGDPCTTDLCGADLLCQNSPLAGLVEQLLWDFGDPALPGFEISGGSGAVGWGASFAMFTSPPRSLYFGDPAKGNFATGGPVAGETLSPLVQLPAAGPISLKGATYIDVEPLFSRDLVWISVESTAGGTTEVWNKEAVGGTTAQAWLPIDVDLTTYAGQNVRIVFGFDSIDQVDNFGEGVYFDDVSLWWTCGN